MSALSSKMPFVSVELFLMDDYERLVLQVVPGGSCVTSPQFFEFSKHWLLHTFQATGVQGKLT